MSFKQFGPLTPLAAFNDPEAVINYAEGPPRMVPGFADMQRMTSLLLAEVVPENGRVLVLGGGGGLELKVFATTHPNWKFVGIDPSDAMLNLAKKLLVFHLECQLNKWKEHERHLKQN
ncbi:MAG: hypothetical protein K0R49_818 [Burkholderiales bacterium]|jgi:tRNA (cmo5U34)-methyltransferase|nr:hypothetical protein [Burkholderiales bacterium]